ncbi:hypothetical protein LVD17_08520 [Fulvivirga ulvae]|uniref:hypothetical protein n=1 Tax=Fulvivirga ulvae TaxID=2904245 RepID=UPI001F428E07|nr:hypothetical protein [Fulvivirga ulvae]UII33857.1 hypothetical protein LVD17_08520 [Fulvivirga ulvae]
MRLPFISFLALILISSYCSYSQTLIEIKEMLIQQRDKDIPISHISAYQAADSLREALLSSGIDTVLLFYKTDNSFPAGMINEDGTDEHKYAFLLWKSNDNIFI